MKSLFATAALFAGLIAGPALAQSITVYDSQDLQGDSRTYGGPESNMSSQGFNDRTYSLFARGKWQVCLDRDFQSACRVYEGRVPDLGDMGGKITSLRPVPTSAYDPGRPGGGFSGRGGAVLFGDFRFSGDSRRIDFEVPNLGEIGFNDVASSMRIPPGTTWQVCQDVFFRGNCITITSDVFDFGQLSFNDRISSIRQVDAGFQGGGGGYGPGGGFGNDGWDNWRGSGERAIATGRTAGFFTAPRWNGRPIPACWGRGSYGTGSQCAEQTADQFCQRQGYRDSAYYSISRAGRDEVLEDVLCRR